VHEHLETFLAEVRAGSNGDGLPRFRDPAERDRNRSRDLERPSVQELERLEVALLRNSAKVPPRRPYTAPRTA